MTLSPDRWLRRLGANPQARLRLFCLPYAGGGTAQYRPWARLLPPEVEPYALCLPGREERINERPVEHMEFAPGAAQVQGRVGHGQSGMTMVLPPA